MEMFYLTTHSTHFSYGYMVKDHSDGERANPLPPHGLPYSERTNLKLAVYMLHPGLFII